MKLEKVIHPIEPIYNKNSRILILGSFPSVKSRAEMFFYGHRQNRFWKVTSAVFGKEIPNTIDEKRRFLIECKIAVWDVIASCRIEGSSDNSIKDVKANDISKILESAPIEKIFVNGKTAEKYYNKYIKEKVGREAITLPSTSPANAAKTLQNLIKEWSIIKE